MKKWWSLALALALIGSPGAAATDFRAGEASAARTGMFAGATLRIGLTRKATRPAARLVAGSYRLAHQPGAGRASAPVGLELGLSRSNSPQLFLGGQKMADVQRRLGFKGSTATIVLIGGAIAVVVGGVLLLGNDNDDCCLDPNICEPCDD